VYMMALKGERLGDDGGCCFPRRAEWGWVRGRVVGYWYCVFRGVSPVGVYSIRGAFVMLARRSDSGCWMVDVSGGRVAERAVLWVETSFPISRTRSYVETKWSPMLVYDCLIVDARPPRDSTCVL